MRIFFAFAALMCVSRISAFQIATVASDGETSNTDCAKYLIKLLQDVQNIVPLIQDKDWSKALATILNFMEDASDAYKCIHPGQAGSFFQQIKLAASDHCPYLACLHSHLAPSHVLGVEFVKLLVKGKQDSAKEILPDIIKELTAATECKKH